MKGNRSSRTARNCDPKETAVVVVAVAETVEDVPIPEAGTIADHADRNDRAREATISEDQTVDPEPRHLPTGASALIAQPAPNAAQGLQVPIGKELPGQTVTGQPDRPEKKVKRPKPVVIPSEKAK